MKMRKAVLWTTMMAMSLAVLAGCDNLTRERYEMITVNVDREFDVAKMIGDPNDKLPGQWHYQRPDKHLSVIISFDEGGTVSRKQWIDAENANWEDTQEPPADTSTYESTKFRRNNQ